MFPKGANPGIEITVREFVVMAGVAEEGEVEAHSGAGIQVEAPDGIDYMLPVAEAVLTVREPAWKLKCVTVKVDCLIGPPGNPQFAFVDLPETFQIRLSKLGKKRR